MIDWTTVFTNVGSFTAFSGIIAWVVRSIANNYLDKDLEKFKSDLKLKYLKSQRIHEERLSVLKQLYEKLVSLQIEMKKMTAILKYVEEDYDKEEEERINNAGNAYNEFYIFYRKNKILFPPRTCKTIDELVDKYFSSLMDYSQNFKYDLNDIEKEKSAYDNVNKEIPKSLKDLEKDFRKLMGSEPKN